MKYSVLMSVYIKESPVYLKESLESMVNQTIKPSEIVLVKDGPLTEALEEVIQMYVDRFPGLFNIIEFKENRGLGEALRVGVTKCSNELIARMDTDDIALPDRCEKQLKEFEKNSGLDIVGCQIIEFEGNTSNEISRRILPTEHEEIYEFAKKRCPFNHMTVMYKKDSVIKVGNYKSLPLFEDYYLWVRMFVSGCKAKNINEFLVYARTGKDMIKRRGGVSYISKIYRGRKTISKTGITNWVECHFSIFAHSMVSIVPADVRAFIYGKFLRRS